MTPLERAFEAAIERRLRTEGLLVVKTSGVGRVWIMDETNDFIPGDESLALDEWQGRQSLSHWGIHTLTMPPERQIAVLPVDLDAIAAHVVAELEHAGLLPHVTARNTAATKRE